MKVYVGIDTSNYKTSIAAVSETGEIIFSKSEYIEVELGERGLRQSEVFFRQSNLLPAFFEELFSSVRNCSIVAIGVSSRPRRIEGSYMPCFLAGLNSAKVIGSALDVPVYEFSHQEGHAAAVVEKCGNTPKKCIMFHLSGGTTEFLLCEPDDMGYHTEIIGGTKDISIGQLVDRIGVALGYRFPSGMYLDDIACNNKASSSSGLQIRVDDGYFNLSGIETKFLRFIESGPEITELHSAVSELFLKLSDLLENSAVYLSDKYNTNTVYLAGGVASSTFIRKRLEGTDLIKFGDPELSGDNAVGVAMLARRSAT